GRAGQPLAERLVDDVPQREGDRGDERAHVDRPPEGRADLDAGDVGDDLGADVGADRGQREVVGGDGRSGAGGRGAGPVGGGRGRAGVRGAGLHGGPPVLVRRVAGTAGPRV